MLLLLSASKGTLNVSISNFFVRFRDVLLLRFLTVVGDVIYLLLAGNDSSCCFSCSCSYLRLSGVTAKQKKMP